MPSVTQILDRASRLTGLRDTGSERELALDALNDVYLEACMLVQPEHREYTHTIRSAQDTYSIENHNELDFGVLGVNKQITFVAASGDTIVLEGGNGIADVGDFQMRDAGGVIIPPADYTVDYVNGTVTNSLNIGAATVTVQYMKLPENVDIPKLRDDDIQLPPLFRMIHVVYDSGSNRYPLRHVSENEILEHRRTRSLTGFPRLYSMSGQNMMRVWPRPLPGHTLTITYAPVPRELSEGSDRPPAFWDEGIYGLSQWDDDRGTESTPSQVPIQFHWSVLMAGTVVQMMDKDQRAEEAAFWQQRYEDGLEKMHLWMAMYGGDPATVLDEEAINYGRYPDEWNRGR